MMGTSSSAVLVMGAGTGIGAGVARAFLDEGADIALSYHSSEAGARDIAESAAAAGRRCVLRQVDSRSVPAIEAFVDDAVHLLGPVRTLVYNSGITDPQPLFSITEDQWDRTLDINLKGMFFCVRRVAAHLQSQHAGGSIVLMSSVHSTFAYPGHMHYASSKGAINNLTRSLALELARYRIRVNAIAPGATYVERHKVEHLYEPEELGKQIPLGRVGAPEDVANLALFLASDRSSYITGQVIFVDGGLTLPLQLHENSTKGMSS
jgi:NAD(P)-dependent dehydrogenase (short-subunit alcohol dehydrogenase family)